MTDTELRAIAEADTIGPWVVGNDGHPHGAEFEVRGAGDTYITGIQWASPGDPEVGWLPTFAQARAIAHHFATFDPPTIIALLDRIATLEADNARLREVLVEFLDAARYDPHMSGSSTFMGWNQSQLRRAEMKARAALAASAS